MGISASSGIISGINFDEIVKQLIALERRPKDLLQNRQKDYELKIGAFDETTIKLSSLKTATKSLDFTDKDTATKTIKDFVKSYNEVMKFLGDQLSYDPNINKKNPLLGDNTLLQIGKKIGDIVTGTKTSGRYVNLSQIGIATDAGTGKLTLDETKLKNALDTDLAAVEKVFTDRSGKLIATIDAYTDSGKGIIKTKEDSLRKSVDNLISQQNRIEDNLTLKEKTMRGQFARLESLLGNLNAQNQYITAQLTKLGTISSGDKK